MRSDASAWGDSPYALAEGLASDGPLDALRNYVHAGGNLVLLAGGSGGGGGLGLSVAAAVLDSPIGCQRAEVRRVRVRAEQSRWDRAQRSSGHHSAESWAGLWDLKAAERTCRRDKSLQVMLWAQW